MSLVKQKDIIEIKLAKIAPIVSKIRNSSYADNRLTLQGQEIGKLFDRIGFEVPNISNPEILKLLKFIEFISWEIEFLENSMSNSLSFEIVELFKGIGNYWIPEFEKNFILTLRQSHGDSSYSFGYPFGDIKEYLANNKIIPYRSIYISLPKKSSSDWLTHSVLFHEFAHFVDINLSLTDRIYNGYMIENDNENKELCRILDIPKNELDTNEKDIEDTIKYHLKEYFADIFSAQYIGRSLCYWLEANVPEKLASKTHPATKDRTREIVSFCENRPSEIREFLQERCMLILPSKQLFVPKYSDPNADYFSEFVPINNPSLENIYGAFEYSWRTLLDPVHNIRISSKDFNQAYSIVNNLLEKSISNYFILEKWNYVSSETKN